MNRHGFVRITSASARTFIGDPEANADEILRVLETVPDSDIALFAELGLSGYTCADLFGQAVLLDGVEQAAAISGIRRRRRREDDGSLRLLQVLDEDPRGKDVAEHVDVEHLVEERLDPVEWNVPQCNVPVEDALGADERVKAAPPLEHRAATGFQVLDARDVALHKQHCVTELVLEVDELVGRDLQDRDLRALGKAVARHAEAEAGPTSEDEDDVIFEQVHVGCS